MFCDENDELIFWNLKLGQKGFNEDASPYIWSYVIEKNYDFVQMPITNNFFNDTSEILEYVKLYPNHYKAMNPNLPKFNNIPNPFYLWNNKK